MELSQRIKKMQPSPTVSLDTRVKELQAQGRHIINLGLGEPDFDTPSHIRAAAIEAVNQGFTHYTPPAGILELRQAILQKLSSDNNLTYAVDQIIVGVGTKQLLYCLFQTILNPGDEVLIPTPTWASYVEMIKLADAIPVLVHLNSPFKLTARDLVPFITKKTKAIILNNPANPTGAVIDKVELEAISRLAIDKDIAVIADEIYEKTVYDGKYTSIASLSPANYKQTITINGLSKAFAMTGWRVGYAAGPQEVIKAMVSLSGQMTFGTSSISQKAAAAALLGDQQPVADMVLEFSNRRDFLYKELRSIGRIELDGIEGAFYAFPNISKLLKKGESSADWAERLLNEALVSVVPGEAFHAPPGYVRISFANSMENLKEGLGRIKDFIRTVH